MRLLALALTLALGGLTGCWSRLEMNEIAFPLALGVDVEADGYLLTIQVPRPPGTEGRGAGEVGFWLERARGTSVDEAIHRLTGQLGKRPLWLQLAVVVFGRAAAEAGIDEPLDYFLRVLSLRETALMVVSATTAESLLAATTPGQDMPGLGIRSLLYNANHESLFPYVEMTTFDSARREPGWDPVAPVAGREADGSIRFRGTVIFRAGRMVGELDEVATRGFLRAVPRAQHALIPFRCDGEAAFIRTDGRRNRVEPVAASGRTVRALRLDIRATGYLSQGRCRDGIRNLARVREIEAAAAAAVQQDLERALAAAKAARADIFGFGMQARRRSLAIPGGPEQWWRLPVDIAVAVTLDREGLVIEPVPEGGNR